MTAVQGEATASLGAPFSDATCQELLLLVTGCAAAAGHAQPLEMSPTLRALCRSDQAFAAWCQSLKLLPAEDCPGKGGPSTAKQAAAVAPRPAQDELAVPNCSHPAESDAAVPNACAPNACAPNASAPSAAAPNAAGACVAERYAAAPSAAAASLGPRSLPQLLIQHAPLGNAAAPSRAARALLETAHLVLRMKTLESRFAAELARQKSEAIYHFAYGLSHELNNPLANIATRAGVLAQEESQRRRKDMLDVIVDNAMRGCEMLKDLMLVARPPQLAFQATNMAEFAEQCIAQARPWAGARQVQLSSKIDCVQWVNIDRSALREAVWVLLRNAFEAMPEGGELLSSVSGPPGHCVRWEISDRGGGLSPQALEHCFDPYFSGREAGRGLGLGLAKALRIVQLHAGRLTLTNRPGGGCTALLTLPACEPSSSEPQEE